MCVYFLDIDGSLSLVEFLEHGSRDKALSSIVPEVIIKYNSPCCIMLMCFWNVICVDKASHVYIQF